MSRSRENMIHVADRYQLGRQALERMGRELGEAFLSANRNFDNLDTVRASAFIGTQGKPARVDFTAFAHRRLTRDAHESDQAELSYFGAQNPGGGALDLVRRLDKQIDDEPGKGGVVEVLVEDIVDLQLDYLDPATGEWLESWDSTQPAAQLGRLPAQIHIVLLLAGGPGDSAIRFETKVPVAMQLPIGFTAN